MTLKLELKDGLGETSIRVIGRLQWEHLPELQTLLNHLQSTISLDLRELVLVDRGRCPVPGNSGAGRRDTRQLRRVCTTMDSAGEG